jgi:hypothetical protein
VVPAEWAARELGGAPMAILLALSPRAMTTTAALGQVTTAALGQVTTATQGAAPWARPGGVAAVVLRPLPVPLPGTREAVGAATVLGRAQEA